jgi:excisionase family DNA binding protein
MSDLASRLEAMPGAVGVAQLCKLLGLSRTTLYDMARSNRIPHIRIGSVLRFDPATIATWWRNHTIQ